MHLFPNGQNIQFMSTIPAERSILKNTKPQGDTMPSTEDSMVQHLKQIAPHMNRQERRKQLALLKKQSKQQAGDLARAEIQKQNKEKERG